MYEAAERLTEYCRRRAGDSLRAVLLYEKDGDDIVYIREDLQAKYDTDELDAIAVTAYELHDDVKTFGAENIDSDRYLATVHVLDEIVAIQFIYSPEQGVLISFDPDVSQNLHDFVTGCQRILHQ